MTTIPMKDYYNVVGVQETCHAIKQNKDENLRKRAIIKIAEYFISLNVIDETSVLIPAPQHTGDSDYTLDLCNILSERTGAVVWDNIGRRPDKRLYDKRKDGSHAGITLFLKDVTRPLPQGKCFFVDNVITTGMTYTAVSSLIRAKLYPLVYAIDTKAVNPAVYQKMTFFWANFKRN